MAKSSSKIWTIIWRIELGIIIFALFAVIVPSMICDRFGVNGASMEPTLTTGGHIYVNKLLMGGRIYTKFDFDSPKMECFRMPGFRKIKVGDVAVFNVPFGLGIKRLINIFKENWYFFGGDNVLNSKDSRFFGCVPEDFIVGIVYGI